MIAFILLWIMQSAYILFCRNISKKATALGSDVFVSKILHLFFSSIFRAQSSFSCCFGCRHGHYYQTLPLNVCIKIQYSGAPALILFDVLRRKRSNIPKGFFTAEAQNRAADTRIGIHICHSSSCATCVLWSYDGITIHVLSLM